MSPTISRVAVIGAGTIGASWAAYFLARGCEVNVTDPFREADAIRRAVAGLWPVLERAGLSPGATLERLRVVADPGSAVRDVGFVQESGPEDEAAKIDLFELLDAVAPDATLIASSSSGLLMSRIQSRCKHPQRCVIGHPFNPPHLMPLVEVVGGDRTGEAAIAATIAFYRSIGKYPIHIRKEVRGHIANRLQAALWREAIHLMDSGVASVADIDAAVAYGPGLRWAFMGPSLTFHLAGGEGVALGQFVAPSQVEQMLQVGQAPVHRGGLFGEQPERFPFLYVARLDILDVSVSELLSPHRTLAHILPLAL